MLLQHASTRQRARAQAAGRRQQAALASSPGTESSRDGDEYAGEYADEYAGEYAGEYADEYAGSASPAPHRPDRRTPLPINVVVLADDGERATPLTAALYARGYAVTVWDPRTLVLRCDVPPDTARTVYYSRLSASAAARAHERPPAALGVPLGPALPCGAAVLAWLEAAGAAVINGSGALALERSKTAQMAAAGAAGVPVAATWCLSSALAAGALVDAGEAPLPCVLKPDCGGSGWGVHPCRTRRALLRALAGAFPEDGAVGAAAEAPAAAVRGSDGTTPLGGAAAALPDEDAHIDWGGAGTQQEAANRARMAAARAAAVAKGYVAPPATLADPGPWVLQEWVGPYHTHDKDLKTTYRAEYVGGRLLYLLRIVSMASVTALCPCDGEADRVRKHMSVSVLGPGDLPPPAAGAWPSVHAAICAFLERAGVDVAAIEFRLPEPDAGDARPLVVYDVNTNTNYAPTAEAAAGQPSAWEAVADLVDAVAATLQGEGGGAGEA